MLEAYYYEKGSTPVFFSGVHFIELKKQIWCLNATAGIKKHKFWHFKSHHLGNQILKHKTNFGNIKNIFWYFKLTFVRGEMGPTNNIHKRGIFTMNSFGTLPTPETN